MRKEFEERLNELDETLYNLIMDYKELLEIDVDDYASEVQILTRNYIIEELKEIEEMQKV